MNFEEHTDKTPLIKKTSFKQQTLNLDENTKFITVSAPPKMFEKEKVNDIPMLDLNLTQTKSFID